MEAILLASLVATIITWVVRRHWWLTRVRSWSMYPTLHPGDLMITRALHGRATVHRGDIVVIDSAELSRRVVKRVIGLPGDTVQITPEGIRINNQPLDEPGLTGHGGPTRTFHVPVDGYFVLGDNRHRSSDSRAWRNPYPPRLAIRGRLAGRPLPRSPRIRRAASQPHAPGRLGPGRADFASLRSRHDRTHD